MTHINRLSAILAARNSRNDLRHDRTSHLKALRTLDQLAIHHRSMFKHITNINQATVKNALQIIVHIMKMQYTIFMGFHNLLRKQYSLGQILRHLSGDQITLG